MSIGPLIVTGLPVFGDGIKRLILGGLALGTTPPPTSTAIICFEVDLEPLVDFTVSLGDCGGDEVSAIFDGNDMPVKIVGANVDGTYLNSATAAFSVYGDDDETVIFGPEPMPYVTATDGEYVGIFESSDIETLIAAGDMTLNNIYRIRRTIVEGTSNGQADTYYPLVRRSGTC